MGKKSLLTPTGEKTPSKPARAPKKSGDGKSTKKQTPDLSGLLAKKFPHPGPPPEPPVVQQNEYQSPDLLADFPEEDRPRIRELLLKRFGTSPETISEIELRDLRREDRTT